MWSLQECTTHLHEYLRDHKENRCLDKGFYHPELMNYPDLQLIKETTDKLSLEELWIRSGALTGAGVQGSDYLLANKIHDTLIASTAEVDICPLIGKMATRWDGADLMVPIVVDGTYVPQKTAGGGKAPEQEAQIIQAQLTPQTYTINMNIAEDLVEDNAVDLIKILVQNAGQACAKKASSMALAVMIAGADGDGDLNTGAGSADETTWAQILAGYASNGDDGFISNTMIITPEAWRHTVGATAAALPGLTTPLPQADVYDFKLVTLDTIMYTDPQLHDSADALGAAMTACITLIFDRNNSMLTGRKRWLQLENFSDPKQDLAGAVVSFRQDSVTLYKDAICKITEA